MYEPVFRLSPVRVNHEVSVRGATVVETRVDGGHLHNAVYVGVPTSTEEGLRAVEIVGNVSAVLASCIG